MDDRDIKCLVYHMLDQTQEPGVNAQACNCPDSCPVAKAMLIFDGKWNVQVLFVLFTFQTLRFGELQRKVEGISKTMLTTTLKKLEEYGLVTRVQYNEVPLREEYSLTESGNALKSVFAEMAKWSVSYL